VTKEEIKQAIKDCAEQMGHPPSLTELRVHKGVYDRHIRKHFLTYRRALEECAMVRSGQGYKLTPEALFTDWAELARKLGKVPNINEYDMHSRYSHRPLVSRFGNWRQAKMGLLTMAEENGWEVQWKGEVDMLRSHLEGANDQEKTFRRQNSALSSGRSNRGILKDRPTYGPPVVPVPLAHGPMNELGVMFLFGMMAARLGFVVTRIQAEFPDCEAMREVEPGRWQRVRIEFEFESRRFLAHKHGAKDCDVIVCWLHNWAECPAHLEVIELQTVIRKMA